MAWVHPLRGEMSDIAPSETNPGSPEWAGSVLASAQGTTVEKGLLVAPPRDLGWISVSADTGSRCVAVVDAIREGTDVRGTLQTARLTLSGQSGKLGVANDRDEYGSKNLRGLKPHRLAYHKANAARLKYTRRQKGLSSHLCNGHAASQD